jgi:uncharacterized protein YbaR (Trm112 family)
LEVLACPHCDRLFQVTPAALGKKIRCRGCRGIFHVPKDTASVPLGPQESVSSPDESLPPLGIPCVIDGHDARSCPQCGRTFRMKESFAGKTIRCRGCKVTFRVRATAASAAQQVRPEATLVEANGSAVPAAPSRPAPAAPVMRPPPPPAPPPPTIFEDIGDVLDDLLPGEKVPSVVRPRNVRRLSPSPKSPVTIMVETILGGVVGIAVTLAILWYGLGKDPFGIFKRPEPRPEPNPVVVVTPPPKPAPEPGKPAVPVPKPPRPRTPFDAAAFEKSIREVHLALQREDFAAAENSLADAARHSGDSRDAIGRHKSWSLFAEYANKFPGYRDKALEAANNGREYEIDGEAFVVVEVGPEQIAYRQNGRMVRERRDAMNPRIEMAIVQKWFGAAGLPANRIYLGVRWLCLKPPDIGRGRREWQTAARVGAPVETLMPLLEDPVIREAGR